MAYVAASDAKVSVSANVLPERLSKVSDTPDSTIFTKTIIHRFHLKIWTSF